MRVLVLFLYRGQARRIDDLELSGSRELGDKMKFCTVEVFLAAVWVEVPRQTVPWTPAKR